jgi:hypothetical protein
MSQNVLNVFLSEIAKYQAEILKALKPKLKPLLDERDRLGKRLAGLVYQEGELKDLQVRIEQEIEDFKKEQVERGLAGETLHKAKANKLNELRAKQESYTLVLEGIAAEKIKTVREGIKIQYALRDEWIEAMAKVHEPYQEKFDRMHRELSTFHVSYVRGMKAAFAEIMAEYNKEFPIKSSPLNKSHKPLNLPWHLNENSIYKPINPTIETLVGLGI